MQPTTNTMKYKRLAIVGVAGIIGLLLGFMVYGSPFGFLGKAENNISDLKEQITNLQTEIEQKNTAIANLQLDVQNKTSKILSLQLELESQIAAKEEEIASLQAEISKKEANITDLQSQVTNYEQVIAARNTQITDLTQRVVALQTEISNLQLQLYQLDCKVLGIYFNPGGRCENQIINWIDRANVSIHVLAYCFTEDPIADALIRAHNRSIDVKVVFEYDQVTPLSRYAKLQGMGVQVRTDTNGKKMDDRVMIIDGTIVLTGSMDYTQDAEIFNNENLIVLSSSYVGSVYEAEFTKIWSASTP